MFHEDNDTSIFADLIEAYKETGQKITSALAEELFLDIRPLFHSYERYDIRMTHSLLKGGIG
jgi:hypothetical protein